MTATPIRDLMAEATSPLEYRMPEEYLHAIKKKKKKKRTINTAYPSTISPR